MWYDTDDWIQWVLMSHSGDVTLLKTCKNWAKGIWGKGFCIFFLLECLWMKNENFSFWSIIFGDKQMCEPNSFQPNLIKKIFFFFFFKKFLRKKLVIRKIPSENLEIYIFLFIFQLFVVICWRLFCDRGENSWPVRRSATNDGRGRETHCFYSSM